MARQRLDHSPGCGRRSSLRSLKCRRIPHLGGVCAHRTCAARPDNQRRLSNRTCAARPDNQRRLSKRLSIFKSPFEKSGREVCGVWRRETRSGEIATSSRRDSQHTSRLMGAQTSCRLKLQSNFSPFLSPKPGAKELCSLMPALRSIHNGPSLRVGKRLDAGAGFDRDALTGRERAELPAQNAIFAQRHGDRVRFAIGAFNRAHERGGREVFAVKRSQHFAGSRRAAHINEGGGDGQWRREALGRTRTGVGVARLILDDLARIGRSRGDEFGASDFEGLKVGLDTRAPGALRPGIRRGQRKGAQSLAEDSAQRQNTTVAAQKSLDVHRRAFCKTKDFPLNAPGWPLSLIEDSFNKLKFDPPSYNI